MKSQNEKEFKQLIKKYEAITLEQLKEEDRESDIYYKEILTRITGFGNVMKCILCCATRNSNSKHQKDCLKCVYGILAERAEAWNSCVDDLSYEKICDAGSLKSLLTAIQNRAKHMREVYKLYLKQRS